jgi:hypothetical protein
MIAWTPHHWIEVAPDTAVTVWSRSHAGGDSPFVRERSYSARYALRWHDRPHADREYRVFAADYDPNTDAVDVPTARAHALLVVCEHCGGGVRGDGDLPTYTGCGCPGRIHGRVLEPAR